MVPGEIVMFVGTDRYAKWFFGQLAQVVNYTPQGSDGNAYCRVRWINPVPYYGKLAKVSDFRADKFQRYSNED